MALAALIRLSLALEAFLGVGLYKGSTVAWLSCSSTDSLAKENGGGGRAFDHTLTVARRWAKRHRIKLVVKIVVKMRARHWCSVYLLY